MLNEMQINLGFSPIDTYLYVVTEQVCMPAGCICLITFTGVHIRHPLCQSRAYSHYDLIGDTLAWHCSVSSHPLSSI